MPTYYYVAAFVFIFVCLSVLARRKKGVKTDEVHEYKKIGPLVSDAELNFYKVLKIAVKDEYSIFSKVRISDVVKPHSTRDRSQWYRSFNQISKKHFDFVLCDPTSLDVLHVIELNDKSHKRQDRSNRDQLVSQVCKSAELNLIFIDAKRAYSPIEIRECLVGEIEEQLAS